MPKAIVAASGTGDVQMVTGSCTVLGVCIREDAAAAAGLTLRDGTTTGDPARVPIRLPANGSLTGLLPALEFTTGVFLDREAGTSTVVIYVAG